MQQSEAAVTSLPDAIRKGYALCAEPAVVEELVERYPGIASLIRQVEGSDQWDWMDSGECDAVISTEFAWYMARSLGQHHCDTKLRLRETVLLYPVGVPMAPAISKQTAYVLHTPPLTHQRNRNRSPDPPQHSLTQPLLIFSTADVSPPPPSPRAPLC
jgi:hypothetical protein